MGREYHCLPLQRSYQGLKLLEVMKVLERVAENFLRHKVHMMTCSLASSLDTAPQMPYLLFASYKKSLMPSIRPVYMAFVNLENAFNGVPRRAIWWALCKLSIDEWLVRLIQSMYENARSRMHVGCNLSEEFSVRVGFHQGSCLSSLLFIMVLEALSQEFRKGCP